MPKALSEMTQAEATEYMALLAKATESVMPKDALFALVVFSSETLNGDDTFYASNANRDDMIKALRECANKIEKDKTTNGFTF